MDKNKISNKKIKNKKVGIIIATNDPETCWVAVRYASFHLVEYEDVKIYFVDSGLQYKDICDIKYNVIKLVEYFCQLGGKVYMCEDRERLNAYLMSHFFPFIRKNDIESISHDDKIQSIMTENTYLREFKRVI